MNLVYKDDFGVLVTYGSKLDGYVIITIIQVLTKLPKIEVSL